MQKFLTAVGITLILILVFVGCHKCGHSTPEPATADPVVLHDTVTVVVPDSTAWHQPAVTVLQGGAIPAAVQEKKIPVIVRQTDTLYVYDPGAVDSIFREYYALNYSSDTTQTRYGQVIVQDTLSQNRLQARRVLTNLTIPEVTKTITLKEPPKNRWYIGVNTVVRQGSWNIGAGPSVLFASRAGNAYEVGAYLTPQGLIYQGGIKFTFRK